MTAAGSGGPTALRILLGAQLRRLREGRRITLDEAGDVIRASGSKVSRLETGRVGFKDRDIADLLTFYGVDDEQQRNALRELARSASARGWWHDYSDVLPTWFEAYVGLEEAATSIRAYEIQFVPGLLQTEDYARAVLSALSTANCEATERRVELRMRRQDRLYAVDDPLTIHMVIDEAVLRRQMGGEQVLQAQLERLLTDAQRSNITIQVLPFGSGAHPSVAGSFAVLAFPDSDDNDLVYIEGHLGDLYLEKEHDVQVYQQTFGVLVDMCMSAEQSAGLLAAIVQGNDD